MSPRHKRKTGRAQAEAEVHPHGTAVVTESDPGAVIRRRRQRGPATVISRVAPAHPRRGPNVVRPPAPTPAWVTQPAAIMKRGGTPGIIRHPVPAGICVNPAAPVRVGSPAAIAHHDGRLPATAITFDLDPGAVGRQRGVEISDIGRGRRDGNRSRFWLGLRLGLRLRLSRGRVHVSRRGGLLGGRRWLRDRIRPVRFQPLIVLHHRGDNVAVHAEVVEVNDVVRTEHEQAARIRDVVEQHRLIHPGLCELDDFRGGRRRFDARRKLFLQRGSGRRLRHVDFRDLRCRHFRLGRRRCWVWDQGVGADRRGWRFGVG